MQKQYTTVLGIFFYGTDVRRSFDEEGFASTINFRSMNKKHFLVYAGNYVPSGIWLIDLMS